MTERGLRRAAAVLCAALVVCLNATGCLVVSGSSPTTGSTQVSSGYRAGLNQLPLAGLPETDPIQQVGMIDQVPVAPGAVGPPPSFVVPPPMTTVIAPPPGPISEATGHP